MQSCYFKFDKIIPPTTVAPGHTFLGFVFVEAKTKDGQTVFFPWERYTDSSGKPYIKEVDDITKAGCPYPPPCDGERLIGCY